MGTQADNLFAGENNGVNDVYVSDRRPAADLSLTNADVPDPVAARGTLTYTLAATNNGPNAAPGTHILNTLPASVTFVGASAGCVHSPGTVNCDLGTLANGASTTVTVQVTPKRRVVREVEAMASADLDDGAAQSFEQTAAMFGRSAFQSVFAVVGTPAVHPRPVQLEALSAITGLFAQLVEAPRLLVDHRPPGRRCRGVPAARSSKRLRTCSSSRARFLSAFSELAALVFLRLTGTSRVSRAM
jgi:uncharacterized repeat protein (TIGR01451 family)